MTLEIFFQTTYVFAFRNNFAKIGDVFVDILDVEVPVDVVPFPKVRAHGG